MRRDADDRTDVDALGERARRRPRATSRETPREQDPPAVEKKPRRRRASPASVAPANVRIELVTERRGILGYRYRRLTIEQQGKQANVRELRLQLDFDLQFELATKPRDLVKVRGRRLDAAELAALWTAIQKTRPGKLADRYDFLDSVNPADLDETIGADGEPIAVSTGEEGPCCLTLEFEEKGETHRKRIIIARFREPEADAADAAKARRAPLAALCALVDAKLKAKRALNYRRVDAFPALAEEFASLRTRHYLNMRQFEHRILEAFAAVKDQKAIPLLETELFAADSKVRLQALDALAAIGDERAVPAVEGLIYDDETPVREKARKILKTLKAAR